MDFKKFVADYFNFTLQERRGVQILLILLLIVVGIRVYFIFWPGSTSKLSLAFMPLAVESDSFNNFGENRQTGYSFSEWNKPDSVNPNTSSYRDMVAVGFPERLAKTIIKYRGSGGRFRKQTDLFRIHNFDSGTFFRVKPFLQLPENDRPQFAIKKESIPAEAPAKTYKEVRMIEINTCDTSDLIALRGVGSFLANKIVDYRTKLGGYHSLNQLLEVWKMSPETYDLIVQRLTIDSTLISRINVNTGSISELAVHPYIRKTLAENIVNYRNMHGNYKTWSDFEKLYFYKKTTFEKLRPYLSLE
jgi:DNA uptake protein ComE-like DNA-binding protein